MPLQSCLQYLYHSPSVPGRNKTAFPFARTPHPENELPGYDLIPERFPGLCNTKWHFHPCSFCTFKKLTKMPVLPVAGKRYCRRHFQQLQRQPVLNIRLNWRISVSSRAADRAFYFIILNQLLQSCKVICRQQPSIAASSLCSLEEASACDRSNDLPCIFLTVFVIDHGVAEIIHVPRCFQVVDA